jgi:hypothetical protein
MSSQNVYLLIFIGLGGIVFLGALAIFGLGAYFMVIRPNLKRANVVKQNWETFAREKSLTFTTGVRPRVSGLYQGRQVKLAVINPDYDFAGTVRFGAATTRSGYLITRASATVKEDDLELKVARKGSFSQVVSEQYPGAVAVNEAFNTKYFVTCNSPDRLNSILKPEVQSALLERQINWLDFNKDTLNLGAIGVESRPEILGAFLELVCRIADNIENR